MSILIVGKLDTLLPIACDLQLGTVKITGSIPVGPTKLNTKHLSVVQLDRTRHS